LPDLGPATLMLREEETVRDALRTMIALLHLHSDALYMHLEESDVAILTVDIMVGGGHYRQATDTSVASTTTILRWLLGEDWSPASVCFTHARPIRTSSRILRPRPPMRACATGCSRACSRTGTRWRS